MEELRTRIREFLNEIEFIHLKEKWVARLVEVGIDQSEASKWAAEIGHVVDEFQSTLIHLTKIMEENDPERIPLRVNDLAEGITEVTIPEIQEPMVHLQNLLQEYLPPEEEDEES